MAASKKSLVEIKHLEDAIECSLCNEHFDNKTRCPKNLDCGHHFCLACLNKLDIILVGVGLGQRRSIVCPNCRKKNNVSIGYLNLATNFAILGLAESYKPHFEKELKKESADEAAKYCECGEIFHEENFNFCEVCDVSVCDRCAWRKHKTHANVCHDAEIFFNTLKEKVEDCNKRGEKTIGSLHHQLALTKERSSFFTAQSKILSESVKQHFQTIHIALKKREEKMLSVIKEHEDEKLSQIHQREEILEGEMARLQKNMSMTAEIFEKNNITALIPMRNQITETLEKVSKFQLVEIPDMVPPERLTFTPSFSIVSMASEAPLGNFYKENEPVDAQLPLPLSAQKAVVIQYDRDFLLSCRNSPLSIIQPAWFSDDCSCILLHGRRPLTELGGNPIRRNRSRETLRHAFLPPAIREWEELSGLRFQYPDN